MAQTGRLIGKISSFVVAGVAFAAAIIVGLIPYSEGGYSSLCPSAIQGLTGGTTTGQAWINMLSGGRCTTYTSTMTTIMFVLLALAVAALVSGILIRRRKATAGFAPAYTAGHAAHAAPALPGHTPAPAAAPAGAPSSDGSTGYSGTAAPASTMPAYVRSFNAGLAIRAVAVIAGIVLVSFAVQWLSFLPGILQLLIWTAAGLAAIWQVKRRAAGTDPVKLTEAEAWNPAVVARNTVAWGRNQIELNRSGSQAVRPADPMQPAAPAAEPVQHRPEVDVH